MPFEVIGINRKIQISDNVEIQFTIFQETMNGGCNFVCFGEYEGRLFSFSDSLFVEPGSVLAIGPSIKKANELVRIMRLKLGEIYSNFLDYLNHPSAKQTFYKLSENNEKRIKRGQFPRQDNIFIDIKREFLETLYLNKEKESKNFSHSFWVRGHFHHFRNKERFNKIYSLPKEELEKRNLFYNGDYISRWIAPQLRGRGKLIEKTRNVC